MMREEDVGEVVVIDDEGIKEVVEVSAGAPGPAGPPGPPGPPGSVGSYTHDQSVPSDVWTVDHGLGFKPNVTILDTAGSVCEGDIDYPSADRVILIFNAPFSGTAYLS
jgi:hypothetical protein